MVHHSFIHNLIARAGLLLVTAGIGALAAESAWREEITTPHWDWEGAHAGGTVNALVMVNSQAAREPAELAQRGDLHATTIVIGGTYDNRTVDNAAFAAALAQSPDVVLLASESAWSVLSPENRAALWTRVRTGLPLVCHRQKWLDGEAGQLFSGRKDAKPPPDAVFAVLPGTLLAGLPVKRIPFRTGELKAQVVTLGQGRVVYLQGYDTHWTFFNAFMPQHRAFWEDPLLPEICYAFTGRILRWAAGRDSQTRVTRVAPPATPVPLDQTIPVQLELSGEVIARDAFAWTLHTAFGDAVAAGTVPLVAGQTAVTCELRTPQAGPLLLRWRLQRRDQTLDCGAAELAVSAPVTFQAVTVPGTIQPEQEVVITWVCDPVPAPDDAVHVQVYDPDGRVVSVGRAAAASGELRLPGWLPRAVSHRVRVLLTSVSGGSGSLPLAGPGRSGYSGTATILTEQRLPLQVRWDRVRDRDEFQVITWGTEHGYAMDRNRFRLLRQLGITAIATIGRGTDAVRMASEEGLRVVPTNILVPANRHKAKFDPVAEENGLAQYAAAVAPFTPLGYSLADEPNTEKPHEFRDYGAEIIQRHDAGAPVGFCGVWAGFDKDTPALFAHCDFLEAYSPFHLYTPNLWLGNERDLYRSFRRPGSLITCWTHYAPWADHEPYTRTAPWLWLFEGLNGVSYFDSGGSFAILPPDLQSTHETRWWSAEIREIQGGIGAQLIGMQRDTGSVRILFDRNAPDADDWARGLNETHVPYRFLSRTELAAGGLAGIQLFICPAVPDLTAAESAMLLDYVTAGGTLLAVAPLGVYEDGKAAAADRFQALFGFRRRHLPTDEKTWKADLDVHGRVLCEVTWPATGDWALSGPALTGRTAGEHEIEPAGAELLAGFSRVGAAATDVAASPEFVKRLLATPAVLRNRVGRGQALYLTLVPHPESLRRWLPLLCRQAQVAAPAFRVTPRDQPADTVYLFPFRDGPVQVLGVVQDYWCVPAATEVADGKETALYFHHGPKQWAEQDATLELTAPAHLYDVRRGTYLGQRDRVRFDLRPGRPELVAALAYRAEKLTLEAPKTVRCGEPAVFAVRLAAGDAVPGRHVVSVTLTDPAGGRKTADRLLVQTQEGRGDARVQFPHNAAPGVWRVVARDAMTGLEAQAKVSVVAAAAAAASIPFLTAAPVEVRRLPVDWPGGKRVAARAEEQVPTEATVKGAELHAKRLGIAADHMQHQYLTADVKFQNAEAAYTLHYSVCHDSIAHKEADARRIWTPYPPGLGFTKPNPASWYYNGYLKVKLDDFNAADYAMTELRAVEDKPNARVQAVFDTPRGKLTLAFVLMPDHRAIFQQLTVQASEPIAKITLQFRSFYSGFGQQQNEFVTVEPGRKAWALMGNRVNEPAYGKGHGPCALLVLPEELDSVVYGLTPTLVKTINLKPGEQAALHWALWMFPDYANATALSYMHENQADTEARLRRLFGLP